MDGKPSRARTDDTLHDNVPIVKGLRVTNDDWHGKSDPKERRRIQNRLNQRARRRRKREDMLSTIAGPQALPTPQVTPTHYDDILHETRAGSIISRSSSGSTARRRSRRITDRPPMETTVHESVPPKENWDELAHLINRNFMSAATSNAMRLGLDPDLLTCTEPICTPRTKKPGILPYLEPVPEQYTIPHDIIIDIIPHPQFRHNTLRAIAAHKTDPGSISRSIRGSGTIQPSQGSYDRQGFVVWSDPDRVESWEVSESFVAQFPGLLKSCETLLTASNVWRERRGEKPFLLSLCQDNT